MKNKILFLVVIFTLFGCSNNDNDDFKKVTYNSFADCRLDLSVTECQSAIDKQQAIDKQIVGRDKNHNNAIANVNPPAVDKPTVECDKEKKDQSEKPSDKCNTATSSSSRGSVIYPVGYGAGYTGNNSSMGLQSPSPSPQPVKPFSLDVPANTKTSNASKIESIPKIAKPTTSKPSVSRGGFRSIRGGVGG